VSGASAKVELVEYRTVDEDEDVERKLSEAVEIRVQLSKKAETRGYRVKIYTGMLGRARLEVQYLEQMYEKGMVGRRP
jgi:hypothetical protein